MKNFRQQQIYFLIIVFTGLFLNSCTKKDEPVKPDNQYLISSEFKSAISQQAAIANFTSLSPEAAAIKYFISTDVEVHKLVYKTTFQDQNIEASGLVCLPKKAGNYPIFSFQNSTNTLLSMAPSVAFNDELYLIIESIAAMGYIVVIPDYIGFGVSSKFVHPYLDAKSSTQCILDMIRATKELAAEDTIIAKSTKDLFIFGYSQGGWATLKLQSTIEKDFSDEFNLIASSCGAGPYSLEYMNNYITSQTDYQTPYFLAYMLNAYTDYDFVPNSLNELIQDKYASKIPGLFDGKHTGGSINAELTTKMADLLTNDYRTQFATKFPELKSAYIANSVAAWNVKTPTHLYHGENDQVIPVSMSQTMFADLKTAIVPGNTVDVQLITIPGADHISGVYQTGMQTILWFLTLKNLN